MEKQNWKKSVMLFLFSQNISIFGSSIVMYSIIWYITLKTSSGVWISLATIASMLPQVAVSLWAGVVADRRNRKLIIMISDGFTALVTLFAFLMFIMGHESILLLIVVSFLRSFGSGFQGPAVNALYPQIVPKEQLVRVNGINQTLHNVSFILAPAIGGLVLSTIGILWAFLIDVITASIAICIMVFIKVKQVNDTEKTPIHVWQDMKGGIQYASKHPMIKYVLICYAVMFILVTPAAQLSPLMVARTYGNDVWRLTSQEILWSVGSLLGGLYFALKGNVKHKIRVMTIAMLGFSMAFILASCNVPFVLYLTLILIAGMLLQAMFTTHTVLLQTHSDPAYMGRVFSLLQFVSQGAMPLAILCFGPLGDKISIQSIIILCSILTMLLALWFYRHTHAIEKQLDSSKNEGFNTCEGTDVV